MIENDIKLYVVICYDRDKGQGLLGIKATREEAEALERKWAEIVHDSEIQEWAIGDEAEMEQEQRQF